MTKEELEKYKIIKEIRETCEGGNHNVYYVLENEKRRFIIYFILGIFILVGLFYWYSYRPSQIKKECATQAIERSRYGNNIKYEFVDINYNQCIREKGL